MKELGRKTEICNKFKFYSRASIFHPIQSSHPFAHPKIFSLKIKLDSRIFFFLYFTEQEKFLQKKVFIEKFSFKALL